MTPDRPTLRLPQFPLGSVLFPSQVLPLHVFEPRYRALAHDVITFQVIDQPPEFGVVLIERGWEVGGDDVRSSIGTVAQVLESEEYPDGRWGVVCVGTRRFEVVDWLEDDPYPIAEVRNLEDEPPTDNTPQLVEQVVAKFKTCAELATRLGQSMTADPVIPPDPGMASFALAAQAPLSDMDRYILLACVSPDDRLTKLDDMLQGVVEMMEFGLSDG